MMIIAIDGPSAAGKGTLAKRLAAALNLPYLDTGLLYRATAKLVLEAGADPTDEDAALRAALALSEADTARTDLRDATTAMAASKVAAMPAVRAALLAYQRAFGAAKGAVLDGRDIGTVIFPQADVKLYITASAQARAQRRHDEFTSRGELMALEAVLRDLTARDEADKERSYPAQDALLIDTTEMSADDAFAHALSLINTKIT